MPENMDMGRAFFPAHVHIFGSFLPVSWKAVRPDGSVRRPERGNRE